MFMNYGDKNEFFQDVYKSELEHKHKLDAADNLLVVILLALSGVGIYYAKLMQTCSFGVAGWFFFVCTILFLIALAGGIGFVIASFWPRKKEFISSPKEWSDFIEALTRHYNCHYKTDANEDIPSEEAEDRVKDELVNALREKYIQAGEVNYFANLNKMAYQARTKYCITAAVIIMLLNAIPTYFTQCNNREIQRIEIVTCPEIQKIEVVSPKPKDIPDDRKSTPGQTKSANAKDAPTQAGTSQEHSAQGGTDDQQSQEQVKKD